MTQHNSGWRSHRRPVKFTTGGLIATYSRNELSSAGLLTDRPYNGRYNGDTLDAEDNYVPRQPIEVTYS
jgi:hypothetical protein